MQGGVIIGTNTVEVPVSHDVVLCPRANVSGDLTVEAVASVVDCRVCDGKVLVQGILTKSISYEPFDVVGCDGVTNVKIVPFIACVPIEEASAGDFCEAVATVECQIDEFRLGGRSFHFDACVRIDAAVFSADITTCP